MMLFKNLKRKKTNPTLSNGENNKNQSKINIAETKSDIKDQ